MKIQRKRTLCALLVGLLINVAIMEKNIGVAQKIKKNKAAIWSESSGYLPKGKQKLIHNTYTGRWDGGSRGKGYMYAYGLFMLIYGRKQLNNVNQLASK